jgi:predicted nucleic acid-binding protein
VSTLLVPDASVLLKWVLPARAEADAEQAVHLQRSWLAGACEIVVPTLWIYEVGEVLSRHVPTANAEALLGAMLELRLPQADPARYLGDIIRLTRRYRVTFYDAAYHALALVRGGTLVTADRRYAAAVKPAGGVQLLEEWGS